MNFSLRLPFRTFHRPNTSSRIFGHQLVLLKSGFSTNVASWEPQGQDALSGSDPYRLSIVDRFWQWVSLQESTVQVPPGTKLCLRLQKTWSAKSCQTFWREQSMTRKLFAAPQLNLPRCQEHFPELEFRPSTKAAWMTWKCGTCRVHGPGHEQGDRLNLSRERSGQKSL